ncbi:hypothetical protein CMI37_15960 [Candidatus Pacearchaeota archaeon]|nr:hypothetical protein [Candidatus Pacearchaeota archaeon]|tara:strand:- start:1871 stop:2242 length:372 start_codon:yes stop_codon:yes gene_type:complete
MSVQRLTEKALKKILRGQVREDVTCVVKFYSNGCPYCKALSGYYEDIARDEEFSALHFFAFNVDDYPKIEKLLNFDGVPTISVIKAKIGIRKPKIRTMAEPAKPNKKTWYYSNDIKKFIEEQK